MAKQCSSRQEGRESWPCVGEGIQGSGRVSRIGLELTMSRVLWLEVKDEEEGLRRVMALSYQESISKGLPARERQINVIARRRARCRDPVQGGVSGQRYQGQD